MSKKPLKRHKSGMETEFYVLEKDGSVSTRVDSILDSVTKLDVDFPIQKEYTYNMLEITSQPRRKILDAAQGWLQTIDTLLVEAEKNDMLIYPYAVYPGRYAIARRPDPYYRLVDEVLGGPEEFQKNGRVAAFHYHYCLPYSTFDRDLKQLRMLYRAKNRETLLSMYNALIAADPAMSAFVSASPFYLGENVANDCRNLLVRDHFIKYRGKIYKGLYHEQKIFGKLPRYVPSISTIIRRIERRHQAFEDITEKRAPHLMSAFRTKHPMQIFWGPLRVTRYGTFEYRGMGTNLPSYMLGTALLLKYMLKRIKDEQLIVTPSDIGMMEPFKIEGNRLHVPPYHHMSEVLEPQAIQLGTYSDKVFTYMKQVADFSLKYAPKKTDLSRQRINDILETGKTRSDIILKQAVDIGWLRGKTLKDNHAKELAIKGAEDLKEDMSQLLSKELVLDVEQ